MRSRNFIFQYFSLLQGSIGKCIEWRPTEVLVDSETNDQEWAVVNAVGRRNRTSSGKFFPPSVEIIAVICI
jgi:hypothetical protein